VQDPDNSHVGSDDTVSTVYDTEETSRKEIERQQCTEVTRESEKIRPTSTDVPSQGPKQDHQPGTHKGERS